MAVLGGEESYAYAEVESPVFAPAVLVAEVEEGALASPDCKTMYPAAQMMGVSKDWLVGKMLRVSHRNHEIRGAQVQSLINEAKMHSDAKRRCVSPDTVVKCPNCGTEFRVGRPLADAA